MTKKIARREFITNSAAAAGVAVAGSLVRSARATEADKPVRLGFVGVGGRGSGLMRTVLTMKGVTVPAVADIDPVALNRAQKIAVDAGQKQKPEG